MDDRYPVQFSLRSGVRSFAGILLTYFALACALLTVATVSARHTPAHAGQISSKPSHAIVVRTTENVTDGGWLWILQEAKAAGVTRIDILVKQDEDNFRSKRTGRELQSGELLVSLPAERTAEGWENSEWLVQMLARGKELGIEIWAWWPVFHDAQAAAQFPTAKYIGGDGSVFVDAAVTGIRERQSTLIKKLLDAYDFDGISLDWLRYDRWVDGSTGPLAEKFREKTGAPLTTQRMQDPISRAIWGDLRESSVANWVAQLIASSKSRHPSIKWGAYLLPPQFKEVSQNYRYLAQAGLGYLQPMIYWDLWGNPPEWSGDVVGRRAEWLEAGAVLLPTIDLNRPGEEFVKSFDAMGQRGVPGFLWYLDTSWTKAHFGKIGRIQNRWREAHNTPGAPALRSSLKSSGVTRPAAMLQPAEFAPDSSIWALVLLAELYDQNILKKSDLVVPVVALHRFVESAKEHGKSIWVNSADYIERFFKFLADRKFSVIPLSHLQAYMMSGAPDGLPDRPLVLTVDDGARSILKHFHPKARAHNLPYSLSVITSPIKANDGRLNEHGKPDHQLALEEIQQIVEAGGVELVSHTHRLHRYIPPGPGAARVAPAVVAREWLAQHGRRETPSERYHRILHDLTLSRQTLTTRGAGPVTILAWPFGAFDETAERAAREAGFTHFLLFGGSRFAQPSPTPHRIARIPITREDESIPMALPKDHLTAQRWWLTFLIFARQTGSAQLVEATLIQLDDERSQHPEAELSRAAVDALRGRPQLASRRIQGLRAAHPDNPAVKRALAEFLTNYKDFL